MKGILQNIMSGVLILIFIIGCGVKGRPIEPQNPPFIGHGLTEEPKTTSSPLPKVQFK